MNLEERIAVFMDKVMADPNSGCWLWTGSLNRNGYGNFWHAGKCLKAHRFSHLAFIGPIPDGLDVMHKCDVRYCVNPAHLRAGTTLENVRDAWAKGRMNSRRGELNCRARLTEFGVHYIREMGLLGYTRSQIARKFRVDRSTIGRVLDGNSWSHA